MNNLNQSGINLIKEFEGKYNHAYKDCVGVLTIGYGHTNYDGWQFGEDAWIDDARCESLLVEDLQRYINDVRALGREWNDNQFSALVSFHYNTGSIKTLCNNRNNLEIADALLLYNKADGKVFPGLVRRRKAERELFLSGSDSKPVECNINPESISVSIYVQLQKELNTQGFRDKNGNTLKEDGIPGELTLSACPTLKEGCRGSITQWMQLRVMDSSECDGVFGAHTKECLEYMQRKWGITVDGICGKQTWSKILGM